MQDEIWLIMAHEIMHFPRVFDIAAKDMTASCKNFPSESIMTATYKTPADHLLSRHHR
ncbi:hypothetical protein SCLCIDRAFT_1218759 [Scleroderma citrinum Foug A]|uniref:Uncharacterized protein n=1 Tax=Scleroderma citrinum Foug A TaxID=1036808 RepID=A0A0C3DQC1_9AGAM|nr:hypothetical protein SCLCIDRAFT_1218759 [Scleroderma citrinum Foug A]